MRIVTAQAPPPASDLAASLVGQSGLVTAASYVAAPPGDKKAATGAGGKEKGNKKPAG